MAAMSDRAAEGGLTSQEVMAVEIAELRRSVMDREAALRDIAQQYERELAATIHAAELRGRELQSERREDMLAEIDRLRAKLRRRKRDDLRLRAAICYHTYASPPR
eukprot:TRINITY_DN18938_c0_g1_i1.p2 TRINITY_DN18938_c0_g1~~TRINITY_DN18938_c0_g1_i1.p2  ORF type:complete len:119 (+),score=45.42 TRINITY_DN18938_c0_g1_i1:42-359(+)